MALRLVTPILVLAFCTPLAVRAQAVTESLKTLDEVTNTYIMSTAEMLDDELYAYRPTDEVRSTGEILGHIANAQFMFCSAAAGEENPNGENFEERTTKAGLIEALEMGFTYCDGVYDAMTDEAGAGSVDLFGGPNTAHGVLSFNSAHNFEHYGNLVTYMRLNGIVPPSSM